MNNQPEPCCCCGFVFARKDPERAVLRQYNFLNFELIFGTFKGKLISKSRKKNSKRKTATNVRWRHSPLPLNKVASACKFTSCSATVLVFVAFFNRKCRRSDSVSPPNNCEMPFVLCISLRSDVYVASLLFFHCSFLRTFFGLLSWFLHHQLYSYKIWWDLVGNLVRIERVSNLNPVLVEFRVLLWV